MKRRARSVGKRLFTIRRSARLIGARRVASRRGSGRARASVDERVRRREVGRREGGRSRAFTRASGDVVRALGRSEARRPTRVVDSIRRRRNMVGMDGSSRGEHRYDRCESESERCESGRATPRGEDTAREEAGTLAGSGAFEHAARVGSVGGMGTQLREMFPKMTWSGVDELDDVSVALVRAEIAMARDPRAMGWSVRLARRRESAGGFESGIPEEEDAEGREKDEEIAREVRELTEAVRSSNLESPSEVKYRLVFACRTSRDATVRTISTASTCGLNVVNMKSCEGLDGMSLYIFYVDGWVGDDEKELEDVVETQLSLDLCALSEREAGEIESQDGTPSKSARRRFLADIVGTKRPRQNRSRSSLGPSPQPSHQVVKKASKKSPSVATATDSETSLNDSFTNTATTETSPESNPLDDETSVKSDIDEQKIQIGHVLKRGAFGTLYEGIYPSTTSEGRNINTPVALKYLTVTRETRASVELDFFQEVKILRQLEHPNIIGYIGSIVDSKHLCLVMQLATEGSLREILQHGGMMSKQDVRTILLGIARGMCYLHEEKSVMHRDLKTANILITNTLEAKISNLSLAREFTGDGSSAYTAETGSYRWMAPEVITHLKYNAMIDVYSFAITLWEIITGGQTPFEGLNPVQAAVAVVRRGARPLVPQKCDPLFADLLKRCWKTDPETRPRFREIVTLLEARNVAEGSESVSTKSHHKKRFSLFRFGRTKQKN